MWFFGLLGFCIVTGSLLGFFSFVRVRDLETKVERLERWLIKANSHPQATSSVTKETDTADDLKTLTNASVKANDNQEDNLVTTASSPEPKGPILQQQSASIEFSFFDRLIQSLKNHWMVWLGGICIGLSGIFLVKYSIDKGLLGPVARVTLAMIAGASLHCAAEWFRQREGHSNPSFAALAGGASIILYAAILAALHLYQLMPATLAFFLLAVIAIATMLLALLHGPILAVLGLLGGYVVPIFVSGDSDNILGAMIYSLIISVAGLLLIRFIYRPWLWMGVVFGALAWWLLSLTSTQADGYRGLYLAILAYSMLTIPTFNWLLRATTSNTDPGSDASVQIGGRKYQPLQVSLLLIVLAQALSIAHESINAIAFLSWSPLIVVVFLAAYSRSSLVAMPWLLLALQWFALLYVGLDFVDGRLQLSSLAANLQPKYLQFSLFMAVLYSGLAFWNLQRAGYTHWFASLMFVGPPLWMALAYLLVTDLSTIWQWSAVTLLMGSIYLYFANNRLQDNAQDKYSIWLVLAGHFTYSIAMAMLFREATLTLAIALQLITLVWMIKRFSLHGLDLLVKLVLALIMVRLTLNPWLLQYSADVHWSLWTYGGATLCCFIAAVLTPKSAQLRQWLEVVTLQLLVLFLAAEVRYWLYDGQIFTRHYGLTESAINTTLWSSLGLVYYHRSQLSNYLKPLYQLASKVLIIGAICSYGVTVTVLNPLWSNETVTATPIWNVLLAAYGLPTMMAYLCARYYAANYRMLAIAASGAFGFIFINMEIRHLWQGDMDIQNAMQSGELYTYSIVWLLIACATILFSATRKLDQVYRIGMGLLVIVIGKAFLFDMADLEGLLRAVSFMGLGLALLGLAYLHQRISNRGIKEVGDN